MNERDETDRGVPAGLPRSAVAALVRARVLDAELAALLWVLLDARTPVVVAGPPGSWRRHVRDALAELLPPGTRLQPVGGAGEDFTWLSEAPELGWVRERTATIPTEAATASDKTVLLVRDLGDGPAGGPDGERARIVVRALARGYGMLATAPGQSLEDVLNLLHRPAIGTDEDERSRLGVVLVMAPPDDARPRVVAAHYVRPIALDTHGHVQRLPPAILATWSAAADRWDHFAWGALADLAGRAGLRPADMEREHARRAAELDDLATRAP